MVAAAADGLVGTSKDVTRASRPMYICVGEAAVHTVMTVAEIHQRTKYS